MRKEIIMTAKTIEQAVEHGAYELKMEKENVTYEVLEEPKKGFLGLRSGDYKVKVCGDMAPVDVAVGFLDKIIKHMQLNAEPKIIADEGNEIKIEIIGENLGTLIGYHGEILDSLQYLTYLAVNKSEDSDDASNNEEGITEGEKIRKRGNAIKISIDVENYRAKREETLKQLAKKMAERVLRYGKSVTLEPMNAYERRIIHATIQEVEGVVTHSIGQDNDRKIIISSENRSSNSGYNNYNNNYNRPAYNNNRNNGYVARKPYGSYSSSPHYIKPNQQEAEE